MAEFYRRVTMVGADGAETIYETGRRKRRVSRWLKPLESAVRRGMKMQKTVSRDLLDRHDRSSRKGRDGWLRDLGFNMLKANRRALKKLT